MKTTVIQSTNKFISQRSAFFIEAMAYASVLVIGYLDYLTGGEISFSIFYFLPILFYAWHGSGLGVRNLMLSLFSAVVWLIADLSASYHYTNYLIPYWNAFIRLAIFVTVFVLFSLLREERSKLMDQNEQLQALNDQKNQFLGMAAHDLRTPIAIIQMYADVILEDAKNTLSEKQEEFMKRMKKSSSFMLELLDDLLDISVIESGELKLEFSEQDYGEFVRRSVELHRIIADSKKISIKLNVQDNLPRISFDTGRMEQVLSNLIGNALKYSRTGTDVDIFVTMDDQNIVTKIVDQGEGIPAGELSRIFHPFTRTSVKPTSGEKSTGLGLAIAKKMIESHHGDIGVESKIGQGTTFYFRLPAHPPPGKTGSRLS